MTTKKLYDASMTPPLQNIEVEKILMDLWVTDPHEVPYTIVVPEAKTQLLALIEAKVLEARIEAIASYKKVNKLLENEIRIDENEVFMARLGRYTETSGVKVEVQKHIATLKSLSTKGTE